MVITFGPQSRSTMAFGPSEIPAQRSWMPLRVRFRTDSAMTPVFGNLKMVDPFLIRLRGHDFVVQINWPEVIEGPLYPPFHLKENIWLH